MADVYVFQNFFKIVLLKIFVACVSIVVKVNYFFFASNTKLCEGAAGWKIQNQT